jgi:hypothetical protein
MYSCFDSKGSGTADIAMMCRNEEHLMLVFCVDHTSKCLYHHPSV